MFRLREEFETRKSQQLADELGEACHLQTRELSILYVHTHTHAHTYVESKEKKDKDLRRE